MNDRKEREKERVSGRERETRLVLRLFDILFGRRFLRVFQEGTTKERMFLGVCCDDVYVLHGLRGVVLKLFELSSVEECGVVISSS